MHKIRQSRRVDIFVSRVNWTASTTDVTAENAEQLTDDTDGFDMQIEAHLTPLPEGRPSSATVDCGTSSHTQMTHSVRGRS